MPIQSVVEIVLQVCRQSCMRSDKAELEADQLNEDHATLKE